jgi:hypothetical protein
MDASKVKNSVHGRVPNRFPAQEQTVPKHLSKSDMTAIRANFDAIAEGLIKG